jgi:hypothetical protein
MESEMKVPSSKFQVPKINAVRVAYDLEFGIWNLELGTLQKGETSTDTL